MKPKPIFKNKIQIPIDYLEKNKVEILKKNKYDKIIIPKEIFKSIISEKRRQFFLFFLFFILFFSSITFICLFQTVINISIFAYIIPIFVLLLSSLKFSITVFERKRINKDIQNYEFDLKNNLKTPPNFIISLYKKIQIRQISSNWLFFLFLFYSTLIFIPLWFLRDYHYWIFHFDQWIKAVFQSANIMIVFFTVFILFISIFYIFFSIQRKKATSNIFSYYGFHLSNLSSLEQDIKNKNKFYKKIFIFSLIIIFLIPFVIFWIFKMIIRRKK